MSRIYDSSALTQRKRDLAQAGSFINRIQNPNNPQTSYGPLQGNYDASIMNSIKMGQPKEFYRNSGCIMISNGCPCPPIAINEIISGATPPVILAPGPVTNIQVTYGSVIVTWDAPTTGGTPTSYTVSAIPSSGLTVTVTGVLTTTYSFATLELLSGVQYEMSVIGVNSAGEGPLPSLSPPIYAPYGTPAIISVSQNSQFDQLVINVNYNTRPNFNLISGTTTFNIFAYINDVLQTTPAYTSIITSTTTADVTVSGLTQNPYTFAIQIVNAVTNSYSSISSRSTPAVAPTAPPPAPTNI